MSIAALGFVTSCSSDDFIFQEETILIKDSEVENLKFKNENENDSILMPTEKSLTSCSAIFYDAHPSFDNSFQF
ncbi:MAG: hypothetical protein COZ75_04160 [Flavobacteriaceae bacterium CG_4_8_14_3_um_filter_34_10]|nr:MAG: hypothetical protein AUK33_06575 [Flavobacteriaceae bacterium CG2_30_34_30]PIQ19392.1 MAG: hypothetical protein COW66_01455 [Flavobacteriaceae bacterium CG18_big_fil_WC_8_21_14_2_50_34_36]PIV50374.1 MAG: hypothetical protein COS19_04160 [Flavobacteriaceae bacterium CG02_land_8_20_14_3_00_34_13]PIX09903.1 MAG: hypothetical protein COZ75_04160 [Flavobacteriaceae bacterium CG_4_8_14_3_um_filter_34_10]PIZ08005.1 MAG: hypothetical protein COY56_06005 [Flavobacteriaceae bacterium CG_4_10_14_0